MTNLVTVTRYYGKDDNDLQRLWRFIDQALTYSKRVIIGVNQEKDGSCCIVKSRERIDAYKDNVEFVGIQPWIGISTPLNILLNLISAEEKFVVIQSVEIQCNSSHIDRLLSYFVDDNVLCVGAALDGHQNVLDSENRTDLFLQGDTSPWNTFIIWDAEKLRRTGFPLCSDFVDPPGMEDAAVIALQQKLFGGRQKARAILVKFSNDLNWLTNFEEDQNRLTKHQTKMKSKNLRTRQILEMLNINEEEQIDLLGVEYFCNLFTQSGE